MSHEDYSRSKQEISTDKILSHGRSKIVEADPGYKSDEDADKFAGQKLPTFKMNTKNVRGVSAKERVRRQRENKASAVFTDKKNPASKRTADTEDTEDADVTPALEYAHFIASIKHKFPQLLTNQRHNVTTFRGPLF